MQDLRLVGVHDGGEHLLLSGTGGEIYRLRIDEALRVASSRAPHRSARQVPSRPASTGGSEPVVNLSPRDIQARIRAGATAQEVAGESGLNLARIERYEGPVRAERDYMAQQAQKVEVAAALPHHDGYRSAFGDNAATLGEMVSHRLTAYGLESNTVEWDAWRRPDGSWNVVARFEADSEAADSIGEQPPAQWTFNPMRKTVQNGNRWAQVLSELEPMDGPLPARRLSAVADRVFDFEAEKDDADDDKPADDLDSDNLLDVLRSRRGQRIGSDEDGDDALALMLNSGGVPAAHPRNEEAPGGADDDGESIADEDAFPALSLAPNYREDEDDHRLHEGVSTETREITISAAPGRQTEPSDKSSDTGSQSQRPVDSEQDRKQIKPKRSSVPSWDEIVFGTKGD
ncbi:septation protein SepH [Arthrobacter monumenti]